MGAMTEEVLQRHYILTQQRKKRKASLYAAKQITLGALATLAMFGFGFLVSLVASLIV